MNSYYPSSFFAQYSENPHMSHNVGYNSNNFGFLASRFADQLSAYHNNNFNSDHHRLPNGYSPYHQNQDSHTRQNSSGNSGEHGGRSTNFQPPPAHQSEDNLVSRSFSNCSTENWSPPPHGVQSSSPDSVHNSTSPYSTNADSCPLMLQKTLKTDQNQNTGSEPPTPFYPWMGIVGKYLFIVKLEILIYFDFLLNMLFIFVFVYIQNVYEIVSARYIRL